METGFIDTDSLPHPTLIGGFEPKVQGAGIVTIPRWENNQSG